MNATQKLIDRMLAFKGDFDGYPSMECSDEGLVHEAMRESPTTDGINCPIVLMTSLASEHVKTPEQYRAAKKFIAAYVESAWVCNMTEGNNAVHAGLGYF